MRARRTAPGAAAQPIAALCLGSGYNRIREQARSHIWFAFSLESAVLALL